MGRGKRGGWGVTLPSDDAPECAAPLPCMFIGCDRPSRKNSYCMAHNKQHQRRGVEGLTPIGYDEKAVVTPCRRCGGRNFNLQTLTRKMNGEKYLCRYCVDCRAANSRRWSRMNPLRAKLQGIAWRNRNLEDVHRRGREAAARKRAEAKAARELAQQGATPLPCANPAAPVPPATEPAAPPSCASGEPSGTTTSSRCSASGNSSISSGERRRAG